jgi:hypothetical protein
MHISSSLFISLIMIFVVIPGSKLSFFKEN